MGEVDSAWSKESSKKLLTAVSRCKVLQDLKQQNCGMAARAGFEPSKGYKPLLVFKTSAFNRSATSPVLQWLCDGAFCLLCRMDSTGDLH